MKKYKIQCVSCCAISHETTPLFDKNKMASGEMFSMKQEFKDHGWSGFPEYDSTSYPDICCPSCNMCYCDSTGRVIRLQEDGEHEEFVSPQEKKEEANEPYGANWINGTIIKGFDNSPEKVLPEFESGGDGKCACHICGKMLNLQWWKRHYREVHGIE